MKDIIIKFDNEEAAEHFITWLCEAGEQDYWQWMEHREDEEDGNITALEFDYHGGTGKAKEFAQHPIIAKCGRMDERK